MRKHILGFALFALILGSAIFVYRLFHSKETINGIIPMAQEMPPTFNESLPLVEPVGFPNGIYTINAASIVADVKTNKVYAQLGDEIPISRKTKFAKVVIFSEKTEQAVVFQTAWLNVDFSKRAFIFSCEACASMSHRKNYYARVYLASQPDDEKLRLRLENEQSGDYYLQSTSVLVDSGKIK